MKKNLRWMSYSAAFIGMGMAMPSCPGQQAMQQQIDTLQTANMDLSKKVQSLSMQFSTLSNDMAQVKQLLPQMTNVITGQKGALDKLDTDVKQLQGKVF